MEGHNVEATGEEGGELKALKVLKVSKLVCCRPWLPLLTVNNFFLPVSQRVASSEASRRAKATRHANEPAFSR